MADKKERHDNCISLIRLLAALQVMCGHLIRHLSVEIPAPLYNAMEYFKGVPIFFVISGMLVWYSAERSGSCKQYLVKRFWRIYPELWVAVAVEVASVALLYENGDWGQLLPFAFAQGTFLQFWTPDSLRGYGCGVPNGALWTICITVQFYVVAWFAYKHTHGKGVLFWTFSLAVAVVLSVVVDLLVASLHSWVLLKLYHQTLVRYGWLFVLGCFVAEHGMRVIPLLSRRWWFFLLLGVVPRATGVDVYAGYGVLWCVFMTCGVIGFAFRFWCLEVSPDISYGLFLYHMVVVNAFITAGWTGTWKAFIAATLISCLLAYVSTTTVGWMSVRMSKKMQKHS